MINEDARRTAIGVDIGGGSTKIGVVGPEGTVAARREIRLPVDLDGAAIADLYASEISHLIEAGRIEHPNIGIAFPGQIHESQQSGDNSNVKPLDGFPICEILAERFGCQSMMINDADAAALAEARANSDYADGRVMLVTLGTGVGVGVVVAGRPVATSSSNFWDAGHINVDRSGAHQCRQGCIGCLESVASSLAVERDARSLAAYGGRGELNDLLTLQGHIRASQIVALALRGDAAAKGLIEGVAVWVGMAIAGWRALSNPDVVFLGGGLSVAGSILIDAVNAEVSRRSAPYLTGSPEVRLATLGNDAGMIGAAHLVAAL